MANYFKYLNESFDRMYGDCNVFKSKGRKLKESKNDIFSMTLSEYAKSQGVDADEAESWITMHPEKTISKIYFSEDEDSPYTGIVYTDGTISVVGARYDDDVKDFATMRKVLLGGSEHIDESKRNKLIKEDLADHFVDAIYDRLLQDVQYKVYDEVMNVASKQVESLPTYRPVTSIEANKNYADALHNLAESAFIKYCVYIRDSQVDEGLKDDKKPPQNNAIDRYQRWVDFDMSHYGKISKRTQDFVNKAGYQILKDDHGDYEVAAGHFE